MRHDLRIWEAAREAPHLKDPSGRILLGDDIVKDWRSRSPRGVARVRAYYDVHPARDSELTLDPSYEKQMGRSDAEDRTIVPTGRTQASHHVHQTARPEVFERMAGNDHGRILRTSEGDYLDHPAGGCRMGTDPASSVCDSFGRTHDHENLFVVGAPTLPTAGCTNGTLTFVALTLRSAEEIAKNIRKA